MAEPNSIKYYLVNNEDMTLIQIDIKRTGNTVLLEVKFRNCCSPLKSKRLGECPS